jgi:microcystin degradation protein MlrC
VGAALANLGRARAAVKRVGVAGLWHETNTYSARPTELADFEVFELLAGEEIVSRHARTGTVIGGMLEERSLSLVPLVTAGAWPAGRVMRETLGMLFERLEHALAAAGPLDGLLIDLHGAMVAEGVDDVEAEMLQLVRRQVGDLPVAVVLDLHGNPSPDLSALVNAAVAYDTYPHVDMRERGREAAGLMAEMLGGRRLRTLLRKVPLLSTPLRQSTDAAPMRDLQALARRLATR